MVAHIRRTMQTAVDLIRGAMAIVKHRSVPDLAVLHQAEAVHEAALALQDNFINPDPARFAAVVEQIRKQIGGLDAERMRGDVSGLDGIKNRVSRAICEDQLELIDRLHLVQAVMLGAEQGLRDLIEARPGTGRRIRDGPEPDAQKDKSLARQRRATVNEIEPVHAIGQGSEKVLHDGTGKGTPQDQQVLAEPKRTGSDGQAGDAKGVSRMKPVFSARPDTGQKNTAQHDADAGTRPIVADTPDL